MNTKECPVCKNRFETRYARQICCGRSCARTQDNARFGNGNWKGGRNKINSGYWKVLAKGHPAADKNGYVLEHRIVMEAKLGRYLLSQERVHHKNGNREDNRPENLELWVLTGGAKKDPPGQRMEDLLQSMLESIPVEQRAVAEEAFRKAFKV